MSGNAVIDWNQAALEAVRRTRLGPPMVARAVHVLHTSMYDAWAAYDDRAVGTRLGDPLRRPRRERSEEAKQEAVSFAAYHALVDLFPTQRNLFIAVMGRLGYDPDAVGGEGSPSAVGTFAARAVLAPFATATGPISSVTWRPAPTPTGPATVRSTPQTGW